MASELGLKGWIGTCQVKKIHESQRGRAFSQREQHVQSPALRLGQWTLGRAVGGMWLDRHRLSTRDFPRVWQAELSPRAAILSWGDAGLHH